MVAMLTTMNYQMMILMLTKLENIFMRDVVDIQKVSHFIANYAEEFGIPQPAAPRGRDSVPLIYLPCDTTKIFVHSKYQSSCEELETPVRSVKYSTFNKIWLQCLPDIKIASPRDDVCATCEKYRKAVVDTVTE
ncbi:hypothetical protein KUTeg_008368 [Tegillarca granosa]|uniref:Uncharacterized protein n=1 Tax=Tegillarca granosa TaxID=220873 RepID=A0ABQ9F8Z4_TEGGR|nr:hypothetical protein KUTeg_008368 [Tegillarca granosa]